MTTQKETIDVTFTTPAIGARQPARWTKKKTIGLVLVVMILCFSSGVVTGMFNQPSGIDRYQVGLADGKAEANKLQTAAYDAGYAAAMKDQENLSWYEKVGISWPEKWPWE